MRYKIIHCWNCRIFKGRYFHVGQKVKVDIDLLIKQNNDSKDDILFRESYADGIKTERDKVFEIIYIQSYPGDGVILDEFPHALDLGDLILIK